MMPVWPPGRKTFLWTLGMVLILGSCLVTYRWIGPRFSGGRDLFPRLPLATPQDQALRQKGRDSGLPFFDRNVQLATNERTIVEEHVIHTGCGDEEISRRPVKTEEIGLTEVEWGVRYPQAEIVAFSRDRVVVREKRDGFCSRHLGYRYLGIANGRVAIFAGPPGGKGRLLEITSIRVADLPETEVRDLEKGISAATEEELLQLLQGLSSLENTVP